MEDILLQGQVRAKLMSELALAAELLGDELCLILQGGKARLVLLSDLIASANNLVTPVTKSYVTIEDGLPVTINWQSDIPPGGAVPYAERHGSRAIGIFEYDFVAGTDNGTEDDPGSDPDRWVPNGTPSVALYKDGTGNITKVVLSPQFENAVFAIL